MSINIYIYINLLLTIYSAIKGLGIKSLLHLRVLNTEQVPTVDGLLGDVEHTDKQWLRIESPLPNEES